MEPKKEKKMKIQIYYAPLVIFQKYKIIVLSSCDTPLGSFYCVCPQVAMTTNFDHKCQRQ
jgi:hypothetical protein